MKSIMISIKPEMVAKILNGEKTIEIRKTIPKCELPCKVYIYCTKGQELWGDGTGETWYGIDENEDMQLVYELNPTLARLNGKVVAEFTLNKVDTIEICDPYVFRNKEQEDWWWFKANACLDCEQIMEYIGYGSDHDGWGDEYAKGYAWHIDDLKIYDEPKLLQEFFKPCEGCDKLGTDRCTEEISYCKAKVLRRPPQSWCYVEVCDD